MSIDLQAMAVTIRLGIGAYRPVAQNQPYITHGVTSIIHPCAWVTFLILYSTSEESELIVHTTHQLPAGNMVIFSLQGTPGSLPSRMICDRINSDKSTSTGILFCTTRRAYYISYMPKPACSCQDWPSVW